MKFEGATPIYVELSDLCDKRILTRVGKTGRATEYILIGQTRNKPAINPQ